MLEDGLSKLIGKHQLHVFFIHDIEGYIHLNLHG
jgi:hypothetical protein